MRILFYTSTVTMGGVIAELAPLMAAGMELGQECRELQEQQRKKQPTAIMAESDGDASHGDAISLL